MRNRFFIPLVFIIWASHSVPAIAGPCDAYFRFDGDLSDSGGNGFGGQMVGAKGVPATPEFVEGKFGQALKLDGSAAMRAFIDLSYEICPQVTYTAWIKVEPLPSQMILGSSHALHSMASNTGISLRVRGDDLWARDAVFPNAGWMFIAGTWNIETGKSTLHWRNRQVEGSAGTSDRETPPAIWLGALNDDLHFPAKDMVIDEFRLISQALDHEQIMALQTSTSPGATTVAHPAETMPPAAPANSPAASASCSPGSCGAGSYCAVDGSCHPDSHMPMPASSGSGDPLAAMRERNARTIPDIDYERPPDPLQGGSDSSGSGDPLETMRERNARTIPDIDYERPTDLLNSDSTTGGGTQPDVTDGSAEEVPAGGSGGGMQSIADFLNSHEYNRQAGGDTRVCTSFAEVVSDVATAARDAIVGFAARTGCGLIRQTVDSRLAAQGLSAAAMSDDEIHDTLLRGVYNGCIAGTVGASQIPDSVLGFWNNTIAGGGWATIGPRELKIEETNSGNLVAPGDRKFITSAPIMGTQNVTLGIEELDGRARVTARVCTVNMHNRYTQHHVFSFNETPEERENQQQTILQDLNNVGWHFLIVKLDAEGTPNRHFKYELKVYK